MGKGIMSGNYIKLATWILVCAALSACGVEQSGSSNLDTGGSSATQIFEGLFLDNRGTPIAEVSAILQETGDSCLSNSSGYCQIDTSAVSGQVTLLLQVAGGQESALVISDLPAEASQINFTVNQSASAFELGAVSFDQGVPIALPVPTENPVPGQPTPKGSATPIAAPTKTPDPKAEAVTRGKRVYQGICGSCHGNGKASGYSASQVSAAMQLSQHQNVHLGGSQLNDLVAFLNR